jgi:hypothetical protein
VQVRVVVALAPTVGEVVAATTVATSAAVKKPIARAIAGDLRRSSPQWQQQSAASL